jgi:hypothetical protein
MFILKLLDKAGNMIEQLSTTTLWNTMFAMDDTLIRLKITIDGGTIFQSANSLSCSGYEFCKALITASYKARLVDDE